MNKLTLLRHQINDGNKIIAIDDDKDLVSAIFETDVPKEKWSFPTELSDRTEIFNYTKRNDEPKTQLNPEYFMRSPKQSFLEGNGGKFSFSFQHSLPKTSMVSSAAENHAVKPHSRRVLSQTSFDLNRINEHNTLKTLPATNPKSKQNCTPKLSFNTEIINKIQNEIATILSNDRSKKENQPELIQDCSDESDTESESSTRTNPLSRNRLSIALPRQSAEFKLHASIHSNTEPNLNVETLKLTELKPPGHNKTQKHRATVENLISDSYIPCMLLRSLTPSSKILIYFHGNGEDINLAHELLAHTRDVLNVILIKLFYSKFNYRY